MLPSMQQPLANGKTGEPRDTQSMWSSMLDAVAQGKKLPAKHVIVLGGDAESQKVFLDSISSPSSAQRKPGRYVRHQVPVANDLALGYTYHDIWDAEHDEILARLSIFFLSDPSLSFASLLRPLLNASTIPHTLVILLLDWSNPFSWSRELFCWITLLQEVTASLDTEDHVIAQEVMNGWRRQRNHYLGVSLEAGTGQSNRGGLLPPGLGEWDEPLGLPMCVICQKAEQVGQLEKEQGWREADFDFVMQFLRTVLLKHGASLIYTTLSTSGYLRDLVYTSLGVSIIRKTESIRANVIDRDQVLVPSNWDSWGKIKVLREGFETAKLSDTWSRDLKKTRLQLENHEKCNSRDTDIAEAVKLYEQTLISRGRALVPSSDKAMEQSSIDSLATEAFLTAQSAILEQMSIVDTGAAESRRDTAHRAFHNVATETLRSATVQDPPVLELTGPIQFNVGGVQVDAEDMLQRLRDRQTHQTPEPENTLLDSPGGKGQNEALASFFAGLIKQSSGSATSSPTTK